MRRKMAGLAVAGALGIGMSTGCAVHSESADHYFAAPETVAAARAIRRGDAGALERMIAEGLDVNASGREGMDLLKWSLGRFCLECFETLLEHGADIERPPVGEYTGKIEQLFLMPVMELAAQLNDPTYLAALLRHGGDPNALDVYGARTIIHEAILIGRMDNVRLLVEAGADIDARADVSLATPLHTAVTVNRYEIAYYLLEQGADPIPETSWGFTVADTIKLFKNRGVNSEMHGWYVKVVDLLGLDPDEVILRW